MNTKYKYPASISTPEARKVYRSLRRQIKNQKQTGLEYYAWFDEERTAHNALKAKLKELAR